MMQHSGINPDEDLIQEAYVILARRGSSDDWDRIGRLISGTEMQPNERVQDMIKTQLTNESRKIAEFNLWQKQKYRDK